MPLQATSGAASYDAFGGGVAAVPNYIEDVFNSYLWTTSGSNQTLTTGIDMTKGALTWIKGRSNAYPHILQTGIGGGVLPDNALSSNSTAAYAGGNYRIADSTTGFTMGVDYYTGTPQTAVVWTFRKQPKFFDVVTWTGNATTRTIAHNLGSVPGCIIIKRTDDASDWTVYHRGVHPTAPADYSLFLNTTAARNSSQVFNFTAPTSTDFTIYSSNSVNASGGTYVAYLFAHDAGGFGLTGTDNVISCGSTDTTAGTATINLGYEPQWILWKVNASGYNWYVVDNMRGLVAPGATGKALYADSSSAEGDLPNPSINITSTGFTINNSWAGAVTGIYIAIRRGPMKVPTSGTSVFEPASFTSTASRQTMGSLPVVDMFMGRRTNSIKNWGNASRLTGNYMLKPNLTDAQDSNVTGYGDSVLFNLQDGSSMITAGSGDPFITYNFHRAPSTFDVVCYTGTGSATTVAHNLGVAPELMIVKGRTNTFSWFVYEKDVPSANQSFLTSNTDSAVSSGSAVWNSTSPTSSVFSLGSANAINQSGQTFVAYLFATCAGVSKVGSYTGTGTTKQIDCGFTGGARFVLIKRTDSTGDWYVWDSARGIVAGNDPYLLLNSTAAEVTSTDYVDTYSAGFEISSTAPAAINASGGTFIFLAIA